MFVGPGNSGRDRVEDWGETGWEEAATGAGVSGMDLERCVTSNADVHHILFPFWV